MGIFDKFKKDKKEEKSDEAELKVPSYMRESERAGKERQAPSQEARIPERKQVSRENEPAVDFPFLDPNQEQEQSPPPQSGGSSFDRERTQSRDVQTQSSSRNDRDMDLILSKLDNIDQRLRFIEDRLKRRGTI